MEDLLTLVTNNKCISHNFQLGKKPVLFLQVVFYWDTDNISYTGSKLKPPQNPYTPFICCHALPPPTPTEHQP